MRTGRRRVLAGAAAGVAVAFAAGLLVWAPWQDPAPARDPAPTASASPEAPGVDDPDRLVTRLGGLAILVPRGDPALAACAPPPERPPPTPPADAEAAVDEVVAATEDLRELTLADPPPTIELLEDAEMTDRVARAFAGRGDAAQVDLDQRALTALGAIAPGTDLAALRVDAFASQVSGYHRGEENEIALRIREAGRLSPLERVVLAHELEHSLSYTGLDRPAGRRGDDSTDAVRATSAVVEGSATLAMRQYAAAALTPAGQETMFAELVARADAGALAGYSPYLMAELQFPYTAGLRYSCHRWLDGGWAEVDAGYRDPPMTTAAVLFPERTGERPRDPAPLGDPGERWEHARETAFGAAELEWLLAAPGGDRAAALDQPRERVAAWDGGTQVVWTAGDATAVGLALVDRAEGPPLCGTVRDWYAAALPDATVSGDGPAVTFAGADQHAALTCDGDQVRLGIAPTAAEATAISRGA